MVPLTQCPVGSRVRISQLPCDHRCRCRLCALGLTPGVEVLVRSSGPGCRLRVRGAEVCLGGGMAEKVLVTRVDS
jgi:ferrous iron transport protein A